MEILLLSIYGALCWIIFKIFKIPLNKWTLPTAALGGIVLIFFVLLIMNYNHPFTKEARIYFYTTPIVPVVRGPVIEVPVQPNKPLKKGDVLFRIDPRPYEYALQQKRAALAEAEQAVKQLGAAAEAAQAKANEEIAARDRAKQSFARYQAGNDGAKAARRPLPYSELQVENQRGIYLASEASVANAQATAAQAKLAYQSNIDGVNTTVARLQAEVQQAQYDLDQTVFRAPTDGYITQLFLRPGMMAVPLPLRPVMVFVHSEDQRLFAAFQQNALQRINIGDPAEIAFDALPGQVFSGRVGQLVDVVSQGQLQPTGELLDPESRAGPGRSLAEIRVTDDLSTYHLPGGAVAQVAVYSDHWRELALLRKILLRMKSWENYIFLEGH
jgi:multidrug resistance efflux pump